MKDILSNSRHSTEIFIELFFINSPQAGRIPHLLVFLVFLSLSESVTEYNYNSRISLSISPFRVLYLLTPNTNSFCINRLHEEVHIIKIRSSA